MYDSDPYEVYVEHRCRIMGSGRTERNASGMKQEQRAGITVMYRGSYRFDTTTLDSLVENCGIE